MKHRIIKDIDEILKSMGALKEDGGQSLEERIHLFRKTGKRVRALIELAYPKGPRRIRKFRSDIAKIARNLSHVRDRHVAIRTARALQQIDGFPISDHPSGSKLSVFIQEESDFLQRDDSAIRKLFSEACDRVSEASNAWISTAPSPEPWDPFDGLFASYRRGRRAVKRVLLEPSHPERFHDLRKMTKRLGYQVEWMQEADGNALGPLHDGSKMLGDKLGEGLDLRRLGEQWEACADLSTNGDQDHSIASSLMSDGMSNLVDSLPCACRLYFLTAREFSDRYF